MIGDLVTDLVSSTISEPRYVDAEVCWGAFISRKITGARAERGTFIAAKSKTLTRGRPVGSPEAVRDATDRACCCPRSALQVVRHWRDVYFNARHEKICISFLQPRCCPANFATRRPVWLQHSPRCWLRPVLDDAERRALLTLLSGTRESAEAHA